jgi:hypothetical protein
MNPALAAARKRTAAAAVGCRGASLTPHQMAAMESRSSALRRMLVAAAKTPAAAVQMPAIVLKQQRRRRRLQRPAPQPAARGGKDRSSQAGREFSGRDETGKGQQLQLLLL